MRTLLQRAVAATLLFLFTVPAWAQTVTCASEDGKRHYCNADIIDEIKRGCSMLGRNAPRFCDEYQ